MGTFSKKEEEERKKQLNTLPIPHHVPAPAASLGEGLDFCGRQACGAVCSGQGREKIVDLLSFYLSFLPSLTAEGGQWQGQSRGTTSIHPQDYLRAHLPGFSKGLFSHHPLIPKSSNRGESEEFSGEMAGESPLALEKMTS